MADLRWCIGSERFGIAAHEAPVTDFPAQPSQKDGLGRMCKTHWNAYTAGLARDAKARRAAAEEESVGEPSIPAAEAASPTESQAAEPRPSRRRAKRSTSQTPEAGAQGDAG